MSIDKFFRKVVYFCFHGLFLITPLLWTAKMSELFEFPKMLYVYLTSVVILISWISVMISQRKIVLKRTFLDIPLLLFLISQIISTIFSIDFRTSVFGYYSRFHGGLLSTFSYLVLYYAFVSLVTKDESKKLLKSLLIGGVISSLYAFPEHFGVDPSCVMIGAGFVADCWVQDVVTRVFGTFGQPNWLAAYLLTMSFIPLALMSRKSGLLSLYEMYGKKNKSKKFSLKNLTNLLGFILFFTVLLFTKSRSGFLGFFVGSIIMTFFFLVAPKKKGYVFKSFGLVISSLLISFLLFGKGAVPQIDDLVQKIKSSDEPVQQLSEQPAKPKTGTVLETGGTESGDIRKIVWRGAWDVFTHNPIFGTGVETFAYSYYNYRPMEHNLVSEWDFLYNKAHNEWLNLLANTGLFGFLSYISIILVYFVWSIKFGLNKKYEAKQKLLVGSFISGYMALAVSNFFGFSTVMVGLFFFLVPAMIYVLVNEDESDDNFEVELLDNKQSLLLFLFIVIGFFMSYKVFAIYQADKAYASARSAKDSQNLQLAIQQLEKASKYDKKEPVYMDEFSKVTADAALSLYANDYASQAAVLANMSIQASNKVMQINNVHINFYKNRAKILANLGSYNKELLPESINVMKKAIELSPTDPKLRFSLGLVLLEQGETEEGFENIVLATEMKPNYELARQTLGELYLQQGKEDQAAEQFEYILKYITDKNTKAKSALENLGRL